MSDYHMTPEEFRTQGKQVVDWIADYQKWVESYPVLSGARPGDLRAALPPSAPPRGESISTMLEDMDSVIMPGITHWQSPSFFAYYPCNASGPAILGDLLSSGLGVQGMLWATSPACTELETHVLDWLVEMMDLPRAFLSSSTGGGVIQDSASSATLCAVIAARERKTQGRTNQYGCDGRLVAYTSREAHLSAEKAIRVAGIGSDRLRVVNTDEKWAMRPEHLAELIAVDRAQGLIPFLVLATTGTTSSGAFDPLRALGEISRREKLWLHVDAAMAGTAAICPEYRFILDGLEQADSFCFNPHKWMFVNFDCDCFYVADRGALVRALDISREYLATGVEDEVIDYRNWQIPLGRRFRALKLWFVIRYYGVEGLRHHITRHVQWAGEFAGRVERDDQFELSAPLSLNLVCFHHKQGNGFTAELMKRMNRTGKIFVSHTSLDDRYVIRFCVGQTTTERRHVERAWELIRTTAQEMIDEGFSGEAFFDEGG